MPVIMGSWKTFIEKFTFFLNLPFQERHLYNRTFSVSVPPQNHNLSQSMALCHTCLSNHRAQHPHSAHPMCKNIASQWIIKC